MHTIINHQQLLIGPEAQGFGQLWGDTATHLLVQVARQRQRRGRLHGGRIPRRAALARGPGPCNAGDRCAARVAASLTQQLQQGRRQRVLLRAHRCH